MLERTVYLLIVGITVFSLNGCLVAESTYLKKVEETDTLNREYADLKLKYEKLIAENAALKAEVANQQKGKRELEQLLKAKTDTLSQNVSELHQKVSALEAENRELRKAKEEKVREVSDTYEKLLRDMKSEIAQGQVTISELKGKLTVNMEAAILFDSGSADIRSDGLVVLYKMVDTLKGVKDKLIRIEGHTDNVTIIGALTRVFPTNWELSAVRAINVTKYLQRQGIDPSILSATAFGEYRPVFDNSTKEGRSRNRRIEISLVAKD